MQSVAIVGRPNVGKSALFNRLARSMISIVHDQPGVTRDRIVAVCKIGKAPFEIVDTGGMGADPDPDFAQATREEAAIAIEGADVLLFVVDAQDGATPLDAELAEVMRASGRPVVLVVNKVDVDAHDGRVDEFYRLGFSDLVPVSAAHGRGMDDLLDAIEKHFPQGGIEELLAAQPPPRLAIVGRPNAGKSSLINAILGDRRTIVSDIPGTTRDAVDIAYQHDGRDYVLCDTAGIRHRSKHNTSVEVFSVMRSEKTIAKADLNILVVDATAGITAQDKKIAGLIQKAKKSAVIVLNKMDLLTEGKPTPELLREHAENALRDLFFLDYAPVVILSAKTGDNIRRLFSMIEKMRQHATRRAGTGELNRVLRAAFERTPPPLRANRRLKMMYATQVAHRKPGSFDPQEFLLFVNDPKLMVDAYESYLRARIREKWEYPGLPLLIKLRGRENRN